MQTVREQLATEVLDEIEGYLDRLSNSPRPPKRIYEMRNVLANARILDRARAEPKTHHREDLLVALDELFEQPYQDIPDYLWEHWAAAQDAFKVAQSELQCPDGCDTSCRCYQEGLEAQRERVG